MPSVLTQPIRGFASDNNAGVHPEILEAIARANQGHVVAYGDDAYTARRLRNLRIILERTLQYSSPSTAPGRTFSVCRL
jgi:threonine aldolase